MKQLCALLLHKLTVLFMKMDKRNVNQYFNSNCMYMFIHVCITVLFSLTMHTCTRNCVFIGSAKRWKKFVDAEIPEKEKFPGEWKNKTPLQKLCMMRALRPDRMTYAVL